MTFEDDSDEMGPQIRSTGIGGSEAAAAANVDPWQSAYELWLRKRGELGPVDQTEPMRWGTLLEPLIAEEYSRRTGRSLIQPTEILRSEKYPWMFGHLDRVVRFEDRLVECKSTRMSVGWGEPGTDEIPLHYAAQVHHYMIVGGFEIADVAVLIGGNDFRIYTIQADPAIHTMLITQEQIFWERLQKGEPPPIVTLRDAVRRWGRLDRPGNVEAGLFELDTISELKLIRDTRRSLDADEEAHKAVILAALGDTGDTLVDAEGYPLATWRLDNGRKGYTVEPRGPARRFLLKD